MIFYSFSNNNSQESENKLRPFASETDRGPSKVTAKNQLQHFVSRRAKEKLFFHQEKSQTQNKSVSSSCTQTLKFHSCTPSCVTKSLCLIKTTKVKSCTFSSPEEGVPKSVSNSQAKVDSFGTTVQLGKAFH